jgi:hypothetical protein
VKCDVQENDFNTMEEVYKQAITVVPVLVQHTLKTYGC